MKQPTFRLLFFVLLIVQLFVFTLAQSTNQPLEQGKPAERELKGGEAHAYSIQLKAGQLLDLIVDQRGIDVAVVLFAPDGKQLAETDSPNGIQGPEPMTIISEQAGEYRLKVQSLEKEAAAGRYEVKIETLRDAVEKDRRRLAALKKYFAALELEQRRDQNSMRQAISIYEEAAPLLHNADDLQTEAEALNNIGLLYHELGESEKALAYLERALLLNRATKRLVGEAENLINLGAAHDNLGEPQKALVLRRETANRAPAAKSVAVFADPVFTDTDERLAAVKAKQPKNSEQPTNNLNSSRVLLERAFNLRRESNAPPPISRLPFTRREAEAILAAAPSGSWLKALDFTASRETVLSRDLSGYRVIHFATHGLLHGEHPELSGIVLSLVNEQGQPVNGFLRLNEIYNLNLSADLVVLSACQTALGKEVRGEGLIGLTRGFMYAGSPRVVASLWKVDDVATAELMKLFYKKNASRKVAPGDGVAGGEGGNVETEKMERAAFYWAAFEIQGEWR